MDPWCFWLILFSDFILKDFIRKLKESGRYDDSIIIVSADHGQILDHGYSSVSAPLMYESLFHIPLLIHLPGQSKGVSVTALAEQVDLAPTILDLIGKPVPKWMEGESLLPYMKAPSLRTNKTKYSMSFVHGDENVDVRWFSAYRDGYKLIYRQDTNASLLFRIDDEHIKENNLSMKEITVYQSLKSELMKKIVENRDVIDRR